jgi:hypothetical protein
MYEYKDKTLQLLHDAAGVEMDRAVKLGELVDALRLVGNAALAQRISLIAKPLQEHANKIFNHLDDVKRG